MRFRVPRPSRLRENHREVLLLRTGVMGGYDMPGDWCWPTFGARNGFHLRKTIELINTSKVGLPCHPS